MEYQKTGEKIPETEYQTTEEIPKTDYQKLERLYQDVLTAQVFASGVSVLGGLIGIVGASIDVRAHGYQATFSGRGITLGITALAAGSLLTFVATALKSRTNNQMYRLRIAEMHKDLCETDKCMDSIKKSVNTIMEVEQKVFTTQENIYKIVKDDHAKLLDEIQQRLQTMQGDLAKVKDQPPIINQRIVVQYHEDMLRRTVSDHGYCSISSPRLKPGEDAAKTVLEESGFTDEQPSVETRDHKDLNNILAVRRQIAKSFQPPYRLKKTLTKLTRVFYAVATYWLIRSVEEDSMCVARGAAGMILLDLWAIQLNTLVESTCELYD